MAIYNFSALSNGQIIQFHPTSDVLNFDQASISAADLNVETIGPDAGTDTRITANGKIILLSGVLSPQLATSNVTFANGSELLFGDNSAAGAGDDAPNVLNGTPGNDLLQGFGGDDTMNGGLGNDTYILGRKDGPGDVLNDTGGVDTVLTDIPLTLGADFANLTMRGFYYIDATGNAGDNVITGNGGNNEIQGAGGNDTIFGGAGNDTLYGNEGNDWIESGAGNDTVSGGAGQDSIVFREYGAANADTVLNFASDWDKIQLDGAAFATIGASGRFSAGDVRFYPAPGATGGHDADDRIIYDTSSGQLWYDADGNGPGAAQLIATFQGAPAITAGDINVFGTPKPTPTPTPSGTVINGTAGNDSLVGTAGNDTINGFGGNDTIQGGAGDDSISGGDGIDTG